MPNLSNSRIVVCGGTGDVGEGIVQALLTHGAEIVLPARSKDKAERLRSAIPAGSALTVYLGDVGAPDAAGGLAEEIAADGPVDAVVASLGGWWQGSRLVDVAPDDWSRILANNLTSHYAVARAFLPRLARPGGVYVQVLGAAAEYPVPQSSLVSVTAAAVAMMGRVLQVEHDAPETVVRQVMIASIVATRAREHVDPTWVTAREVGDQIAEIIARGPAGPAIVRIDPKHA